MPILRNHPGSVNPIIKSNNLLNNALAMQEAHRRGGEEALMCNYRGELSECSQSNFFIVRGRRRVDAEIGGRPARRHHAGVPVRGRRERSASRSKDATLVPADLETADEVFITSTTRELSPVVRIDDRVIGNGRPDRSRSNCGTRTTGAPWK